MSDEAEAIAASAFDNATSGLDWNGHDYLRCRREGVQIIADALRTYAAARAKKAREAAIREAAQKSRSLAGANTYKALVCDEIAGEILSLLDTPDADRT